MSHQGPPPLTDQLFINILSHPQVLLPDSILQHLTPDHRGYYLIHLLVHAASHVAAGNFLHANLILNHIAHLAHPACDTIQRLAIFFSHALADRTFRVLSGVYRAFHAADTRTITAAQVTAAGRTFADLLPFIKMSTVIGNRTILESIQGEMVVHIIDLSSADPYRWCRLIRDLTDRRGGPPYLKITAVHPQAQVLQNMFRTVVQEADRFNFPLQFTTVQTELKTLDFEMLKVKTGEAVALCSNLHLHQLLAADDDFTTTANPAPPPPQALLYHGGEEGDTEYGGAIRQFLETNRGISPSVALMSLPPESAFYSPDLYRILDMVWKLSPKIMVVTEQEAEHNGKGFMERMAAALHYYGSLLDCLEVHFPRTSPERIEVEKMVIGEEIRNIVACEGAERRERHETLDQWRMRFEMAGFQNVPVSYYGVMQAKRLPERCGCGGDGIDVRDENGSAVICRKYQRLFSVSAWELRK